MNTNTTICSIATAPGQGAIGIIRISGEESLRIINEIFKPIGKEKKFEDNIKRLIYGHIVDDNKEIVDEVMAVYMKAPYTYTREDVVEIQCHGGHFSLEKILTLVLEHGAVVAEKGEFTKRAFLNGRIDLTQAESVIDIINSASSKGYDQSQKQLEGKLKDKIKTIMDRLKKDIAKITVAIDFPEEDIPEVTYGELIESAEIMVENVSEMIDSFHHGKIISQGINTVIVGRPNVGKSSLLNELSGEEVAIVTDVEGTTRDILQEHINVKGIPLKVIDTAGIRDTEDKVEKIGVQRSFNAMETADLIIMMIDISKPLIDEDIELLNKIKTNNHIVILNKSDLDNVIDINDVAKHIDKDSILKVSVKKKHFIEELKTMIYDKVVGKKEYSQDQIIITSARHKNQLVKFKKAIEDAINSLKMDIELDIVETDYNQAYYELGLISGQTASEDLLDVIFREFCIGK